MQGNFLHVVSLFLCLFYLFHFSFALFVFCFSAHPLKGIGIHPKRPRMFVDECTRNGKENQIERPSHAKERAERCRTRATRSTGSGRTCSTRKSSGSWEDPSQPRDPPLALAASHFGGPARSSLEEKMGTSPSTHISNSEERTCEYAEELCP